MNWVSDGAVMSIVKVPEFNHVIVMISRDVLIIVR